MPLNYFRLRTLFAVMVLLIVGASAITYVTGRFVIAANQQIIRQQFDIQQLDQTLSTLKDAETGSARLRHHRQQKALHSSSLQRCRRRHP